MDSSFSPDIQQKDCKLYYARDTPSTSYSSRFSNYPEESSSEESFSFQHPLSQTMSLLLQKLASKAQSINQLWAKQNKSQKQIELNNPIQSSQSYRIDKKNILENYAKSKRELNTINEIRHKILNAKLSLSDSKEKLCGCSSIVEEKQKQLNLCTKHLTNNIKSLKELKLKLHSFHSAQSQINTTLRVKKQTRDNLLSKVTNKGSTNRRLKVRLVQTEREIIEGTAQISEHQRLCEEKTDLVEKELVKSDMRFRMLEETEELINYSFSK